MEVGPDERLARRAQQGDEAAFARLVRSYHGLLHHWTSGYFAPGLTYDDFRQHATWGLWKACRDFQRGNGMSFRGFAQLCVSREVVTALKTATRQKHENLNRSLGIDAPIAGTEEATLAEVLAGGDDPVDVLIAREDFHATIAAVTNALSDLEAAALPLFLDGLSYEQIGERLGCSTKTVDNALQRVKRKAEKRVRRDHRERPLRPAKPALRLVPAPEPERPPAPVVVRHMAVPVLPAAYGARTMSDFAVQSMQRALAEMQARQEQLRPIIEEARALEDAIVAQSRALESLGVTPELPAVEVELPALPAVAEARDPAPAEEPAREPAAPVKESPPLPDAGPRRRPRRADGRSQRTVVAEELARHPDGIAPSKIAEVTGIPPANVATLLGTMAREGEATRVMRGLYRPPRRMSEQLAADAA